MDEDDMDKLEIIEAIVTKDFNDVETFNKGNQLELVEMLKDNYEI